MREKINKTTRNIMACGILSALPVLSNVSISNAQQNLEAEFSSIANKYNDDEIVVENGISIKKGEILDLSQFPGWEMSNDETVSIDENGIVRPINEGTVFLSNKINEKVHIIEVYVSSSETRLISSPRSGKVDRDYYKVFVDAGHGGNDNGSSGFGNLEDELNLQVAKSVETKLRQKGIEVKMSRTSDVYLSLSERAKMANNYGADLFISIHQNSAASESANGIETFYQKDKTGHKSYSNKIQTNAISETNARDRGVKSANFAVLRETTMPSSLFESGFISNKEESSKLSDPVYQDKLASAISNAIEEYLKENIILSGEPTIPEEEVVKTGIVNAASLNVRSGYGTSYSKIGSLLKGDKVEIVETKNGWHKIKYRAGYGYISADYVTINNTEENRPNQPEEKPPIVPEEKPPVEDVTKTGIVNTSSLNVRSGYGTSYSKIGTLSKGDKVEIVESKNGWHKIKYKTGYGYISADYVTINNSGEKPPTVPEEKPPVEDVTKTGVVNTSSLNVRSGYGTSYSKIGTLSKGSKVEIIESKNGWYKIKYKTGYGYISADYVTINNSGEKPPTVPEEKPPVEEVSKIGVVNTSSLNVRSGYGTSYSKIGTLSKGSKVEIIESKNGWYKIKYKTGYGYISAGYVTINNTESKPPSSTSKIGVVNTSSLNVRSGYGTSYSKIGTLSKGAKVEIVESKNGWHKIKYKTGYGYISGNYIIL